MKLAPIRGAPPGAPNPPFPVEEPKAKSAQPSAVSADDNQPQATPMRQRGTPIEVGGNGAILTFRTIPELPALRRASITIHVVAIEPSASHTLGFLQMSAARAREFFTDLRNGRLPIVAMGDEDGTLRITFEATDAGTAFSVQRASEPGVLRCCMVDGTIDIKSVADELLGDLGA